MVKSIGQTKAMIAFKQQKLKAWQPILTPVPVIFSFLFVGAAFVVLGVVLRQASDRVQEIEIPYFKGGCDPTGECPPCNPQQGSAVSSCTLTFQVEEDMKCPVYMYYKLTNFYQNHRRYVKSRSDEQLSGECIYDYSTLVDQCGSATSKTVQVPGSSNDTAPSENSLDFLVPCGLIANSMFNDTFDLLDPNGISVELQKQGIAWSSDVSDKFRSPTDACWVGALNPTGIDMEDEDFIVWMRTAALPTFRKLKRIINVENSDVCLAAGNYSIVVGNNFPVASFGGDKSVVLSTTEWIGGKNPFLGVAYLVVGSVCLFLGVVFALLHIFKRRPLGDLSYVDWANEISNE